MKRICTNKKESGSQGRKRRQLQKEDVEKSSQFFKTFFKKAVTGGDESNPSCSSVAPNEAGVSCERERDKSSSQIEENSKLDTDEPLSEKSDSDSDDSSHENKDGQEDKDEGNIEDSAHAAYQNVVLERLETNESESMPEVVRRLDIGYLSFNAISGRAIVQDNLRIEMVKMGSKCFSNDEGPFLPTNNRSMNKSWFKRRLANGCGEEVTRSWLVYSPKKKSAFCFCCILFSRSSPQSHLEQSAGFSRWKAPERISLHENAKNHRICFTQWKEMERNFFKCEGIIDAAFQKQYEKERQKWREILMRIVHCIKFLAVQNLALRGHRESQHTSSSNRGNFVELIKLLSVFDPVMKAHLGQIEKCPGSTSYLSAGIQNEIIHLMASAVRHNILSSIRKAKYYGLLFDSTPDLAHREQMSEVIRYVEIDFEKKTVSIKESFLGYFQISQKNAESISDAIFKQLEKDEIDIQDCRSQCYDNAAVMAGCKTGVGQRIQKENNLAIFVNCDNHSLNLAGVHSCQQNIMMISFFGTIEALYVFFSRSTQRWERLKNAVPIVVKSDSDTRWSAKSEAVKPIETYLEEILSVLLDLSDDTKQTVDTRSDAKQLYNRMLKYDFLILLGFWNKILTRIDRIQKRLQDHTMNFHDASSDLKALHHYFDSEGDSLVEESCGIGLNLCLEWDVEVERRVRRKKRMPGEDTEDVGLTAKEEIKRVMRESLDRLVREMDERFSIIHQLDTKFGFLLDVEDLCYNKENEHLKDKCAHFAENYKKDVDACQLYEEICDCRILLSNRDTTQLKSPKELLEFIVQYGDESVFPNLRVAVQIMLTIAVSIASCERSFSKLKLILTYLRATMGQDRLCDLALLSIEKEELEKLHFDSLIDKFASNKARKVNL